MGKFGVLPGDPRLSVYLRIGKWIVYIVDGEYIRNHGYVDFMAAGNWYTHSYIPQGEIWLDKEYRHDEYHFTLENELGEIKGWERGLKFAQAEEAGDQAENKMRIRAQMKEPRSERKFGQGQGFVRSRLLGTTRYGVKVKEVNGDDVRTNYDNEYIGGGHDRVYRYIPKNEVWLDDDLLPTEVYYTLVHELYERFLMVTQNLPYLKAHEHANRLETECRHGYIDVMQTLDQLGWDTTIPLRNW